MDCTVYYCILDPLEEIEKTEEAVRTHSSAAHVELNGLKSLEEAISKIRILTQVGKEAEVYMLTSYGWSLISSFFDKSVLHLKIQLPGIIYVKKRSSNQTLWIDARRFKWYIDSESYIFHKNGTIYHMKDLHGKSLKELREILDTSGDELDPFIHEKIYNYERLEVVKRKIYIKERLDMDVDDIFPVLVGNGVDLDVIFGDTHYVYDANGKGKAMKYLTHHSVDKLFELLGVMGTTESPLVYATQKNYYSLRIMLETPEGIEKSFCGLEGDTMYYYDGRISFKKNYGETVVRNPLLPPESSGKPTLVLDLDQTLIHSMSTTSCGYSCSHGNEKDCEFYIAKRDGVDDFLNEMVELYEIVLWTGSQQYYADPIVDMFLDPEKKIFSHRIYNHSKDLSQLGRDLKRVVMIDDSYGHFPEMVLPNVVIVSPFWGSASCSGGKHLDKISQVLRKLAANDKDVDFRVELETLRSKEGGILDEIEEDGIKNERLLMETRKRRKEIRSTMRRCY